MIVLRGEIWLAELNPIRGSEQAGTRPVLVMQTNAINRFTTTILAIPFTTNLRRASLPSCVRLRQAKAACRVSPLLYVISYGCLIKPD